MSGAMRPDEHDPASIRDRQALQGLDHFVQFGTPNLLPMAHGTQRQELADEHATPNLGAGNCGGGNGLSEKGDRPPAQGAHCGVEPGHLGGSASPSYLAGRERLGPKPKRRDPRTSVPSSALLYSIPRASGRHEENHWRRMDGVRCGSGPDDRGYGASLRKDGRHTSASRGNGRGRRRSQR